MAALCLLRFFNAHGLLVMPLFGRRLALHNALCVLSLFVGCDSSAQLNHSMVRVDATEATADGARGVGIEPAFHAKESRFRALLIGVNDYERLQDLKYCEQDVIALKDQLVRLGLPGEQIVCLTASDSEPIRRPTFRNIDEQLDSLFAGLDEESVLMIALSGHGGAFEFRDATGEIRTESFYCPLDARLGEPNDTMVPVKAIYDRLDACPARFKMLLVDACRDRRFAPPGGRTAVNEAKCLDDFSKSLGDATSLPRAALALVSCTSGEQSYEHEKLGHGVFMHFVLKAVAGEPDAGPLGDHNGVVSFRELHQYVVRNTSDYVRGRLDGRHQTPIVYTSWETPDFDLWHAPKKWPFTEDEARRRQEEAADTLNAPVEIANSIDMKLRLLPAGVYGAGSTRKTIRTPIYMSACEVTQGQFSEVMGAAPWRKQAPRGVGGDFPAFHVDWRQATEFCERLTEREGVRYRLPTSSEWEYACRAGSDTRFAFGDADERLSDFAWFKDNAADAGARFAHRVGRKRPNAFGLFDMHGNVSEWCSDKDSELRVYRGGSWLYSASLNGSESIGEYEPDSSFNDLGFRVVAEAPVR